jgi:hypothetical protein
MLSNPELGPGNVMPKRTKRYSEFLRLVLFPIFILSAIIIPSFRVLESARLPDRARPMCTKEQIVSDQEPSDVLFIGTSRTGAAIDPILIAKNLENEFDSAEKAVLTGSSEFERNLLYLTYARHRGVPRVLAIETSFSSTTSETWRFPSPPSATWPSNRAVMMFDVGVYQNLISNLQANGGVTASNTFFRSEYQTVAGYFFRRLESGFSFALKSPQLAITPLDTCTWGTTPIQGKWVLGDAEPYDSETAPMATEKKLTQWADLASQFLPFDPTNETTTLELSLIENLIETAYEDGVESVVLYYLPSAWEEPDVSGVSFLAAHLENIEFFDATTVLVDDDRPDLRFQRPNLSHVNRFAAYEISSQFAEFIANATMKKVD